MAFEVKKARRQRRPLKINLEGVSGSGKTMTALRLAFGMRRAGIGKKIVVADSENDSAGLYEGLVMDGERWEYDVCPIPSEKQNPLGYTEAYEYLVGQGFDIIIGDSLTHAWYGAQEIVDRYAQANKNDKFGGWAKVTPQQRGMLATLTDNRAHFIGTMRVKSEYDRQERDGGKGVIIKKVGTKTDQREGAEYEFDCVARLDKGDVPTDHVILIDKVRGCTQMDGARGVNPGPDFWKPLFDWWLSAEAPAPLHEQLGAAIRGAATIDALKAVMERVNLDAKAQRLSAEQIAQLGKLKDERKAALSKPAPESFPLTDATEGDDRADPTPTPKSETPPATATTNSTPTAAPSAAKPPASATTNDPAPKPAPSAERRTTPPGDLDVPMAGGNIITVLKDLMHKLRVSWSEIRDGKEGKGSEIATAVGLAKMPAGAREDQITAAEALALKTELEARVAEKTARAAKRAANKGRCEAELAAEMDRAS